jgi:hypothetical protein
MCFALAGTRKKWFIAEKVNKEDQLEICMLIG